MTSQPKMRRFWVEWDGMPGSDQACWAETRSKARYKSALSLADARNMSVSDALLQIKVTSDKMPKEET